MAEREPRKSPKQEVTSPETSIDLDSEKNYPTEESTPYDSTASDAMTCAKKPCKPVPPLSYDPTLAVRKKCCSNICKFFGTFDEYHLLLWKTAYMRKLELGDVGIGVIKAFHCSYLFKTDIPKEEPSAIEMKSDMPPQDEKELEIVIGLDGYNQYAKMQKDEIKANEGYEEIKEKRQRKEEENAEKNEEESAGEKKENSGNPKGTSENKENKSNPKESGERNKDNENPKGTSEKNVKNENPKGLNGNKENKGNPKESGEKNKDNDNPKEAGDNKKNDEDPLTTIEILREMTNKEFQDPQRKRILRDMEKSKPGLLRHRPWFTILISILQFIYIIAALASGGIERTTVDPKMKVVEDVETTKGLAKLGIWVGSNPWVGPPLQVLVSFHAVYAACMRNDRSKIRKLQSMNKNYQLSRGCCVLSVGLGNERRNVSFPSMEAKCNGVFQKESCAQNVDNVTRLWPCCYGMHGRCRLVFESDCEAHGGHYAKGIDHCWQVNCLKKICGSDDIEPHPRFPAAIHGHAQGWRWLTGAVLHAGIIHFLIVLILQWLLMRCLETLVGFWRMAILYVVTVMGSNMIGAYYDPYMPIQGSTPALFAIIAINILEIIQGWHFMYHPIFNLIVIIVLGGILLFIGSLPLISNFANVGGLWFGIFTGLAIMPHLNFGKWRCRARRLIVIISVFMLVLSYLWLLLSFYHIQSMGVCYGCTYFECIPYTSRICDFNSALLTDDIDLNQ